MVSGDNKDIESALLSVASAVKDRSNLATDWITPTMQNSWVLYDATPFQTHNAPQYRRDSKGRVYLRGLIKSGTIGQACFTLPEGFRPIARTIFAVVSNSSIGRVDINSDGTVIPNTPSSNAWVSLDGIIVYRVES